MQLKSIYISFLGSIGQFIFLILALIIYSGNSIETLSSFLGSIDAKPMTRALFSCSCLIWGITSRYFWKSLNDILGQDQTKLGFEMGIFSGIGWIGTAVFETQTQGLFHITFYFLAIICSIWAICIFSSKLWKKGNYNKKIIIQFIVGVIFLLLSIVTIWTIWLWGDIPLYTGISQKIGLFCLNITFWIQHIYVIKTYVR